VRIAVIPARGGSKRIPRKNIRPFAGTPIIGYPIAAALACGLFERVIVSTDDDEIAAVARGFGAETPFLRPAAIADDHAGTNAVVKHAIEYLRARGETVDYACCIYATAPFVRPDYLCQGYAVLAASDKQFAFSVTSFPFPIQRALRILPDGALDAFAPEHRYTRSQDLEEAYHDAGQFYWGRADAFVDGAVLFSPVSLPVVLPRHLVQDIDTLEDWRRAELMYAALQLEAAPTREESA
jgi:pseudaminic acid cytidylyltransferase